MFVIRVVRMISNRKLNLYPAPYRSRFCTAAAFSGTTENLLRP
jgi:hypothetical protein